MKEALLTILRDKNTSLRAFRSASDKLAAILAAEVSTEIAKKSAVDIQTPMARTSGYVLEDHVVLIPILRSGIALLNPFLMIFDGAKIGFFGIKRDEKTAVPSLYYQNIPLLSAEDQILLLDPMIATGGSALLAIETLLAQGANLSQIMLVGVIGSTEGIDTIRKKHPSLRCRLVAIDPELNADKYIVPGLGDFGDRYFGKKGNCPG